MFIVPRRGALAALTLLFAFPLAAQQQNPWDAPAFTADAKALVDAAKRVESGDFATVLLLDEAEYVVDADGRVLSRERMMTHVVTDAGVEGMSEVRAPWQPWHDERPTIEARVITREGTVHRLDQAAVVEVPAGEEADIFSDGRILRAPLPAVAAGSIVEYVITRQGKNPIPGGGTTIHYTFGGYIPIERTRLTIDAPLSVEPRIVNRTGVTPRIEEKDGRRRTIYETGRIEGTREAEDYLPYDVTRFPYLAFSTGKSWQDIAASYSAIVDKQIEGSDLQKLVRNAIGTSTDRKEVVAKLLAAIQKDIRYAGVEIGEGSIVPRTPRQVLANKYGDCKDKATMLVAMLRIAGFPAHVALLRAGTGFDTNPELPALGGHFNHAIVVVEGEPAIWVDPTDVFARAGELPLSDQGRMALIAKPDTTTLTRTPEDASTAHVYREQRTFYLPEEGKARVVEVTEPSATSEASMRRWVSTSDAKKLREEIEEYAKSTYVAKSLKRFDVTDANDLTKPFRLTIEVPESSSGIIGEGEGSVAINLAALPNHVPNALRDWKEMQPGDDPDDAPKKRTHDFLFPQAGVREWVYRVVPPAGYVPRQLPPSETKKIGTTTFSQEIRAEPDHTVVATFRFDSGKRRITREEFEETRVAFTKFITDNVLHIGFVQSGKLKLDAGDIRGALDEYRRLAALHPKEAQHHIETARALLAGGLGDAAREEIRRAIAIEPKNARAHQTLGTILIHDSLGRPYRKGFDLPGAIAALRKAKELDPDDYSIRYRLSNALTYGEDGFRFGRGARLAEAAEEVKAAAKDLGDEGKGLLPELTLIYAHMGRFADIREVAATFEDEQQRDMARLIATAALEGTDATLRELGAFDQQRKRNYASGIAPLLVQIRRYPQAAAMMELAAQGTDAAAQQRPAIDLFKKLQRREDMPKDDGPRSVVTALLEAVVRQDAEGMKRMMPREYLEGENSPVAKFAEMELRPPDDLPIPVFVDLVTSMVDIQQDGDDTIGYRLRARMRGAAAQDDMSLFVRREDGQWIMRGGTKAEELTGATVLAMAAKGELEAARKWLNWTREEAKGGSSDDALEGSAFAALWPKAKATATVDEIRVAAAALAAADKMTSKQSEPILVAAREQAATEQLESAIDLALVDYYTVHEDAAKLLVVTTRLLAANPDSATAFAKHVGALLRNDKTAEATALAKTRLERLPDDPHAVRALANAAAKAGDYAAAQEYATKVVGTFGPKREDYTLAAWTALFTGKELERAIELAQHGTQHKDTEDRDAVFSSVSTLATLYAETGRSVEARTALLQGLDSAMRGKLRGEEWYILGRIAENYGVDDYALTAYRKVGKPSGGTSVTELAQRRLDHLVKKKK